MIREKYIDLHSHTTYSDGTFTPRELVKEAAAKSLAAVAVTDHDTVNGISQALEAGKEFNVEVISGIEFAAYYPEPNGVEIHIVGLFLDHTSEKLIKKTNEITENRRRRNLEMAERLTSMGMPVSYAELTEEAGGDSYSRTHFANIMLKKGYVKTKREAFGKYISHGKPAFVPRILPTPKECIDIIKNSGGVSILAHPTLYGMNYLQIKNMAKCLKDMGLCGIETMYSTYKPEQQREITRIAEALNLKKSGGSDFHGANKPDISLGIGRGNLRIPEKFLTELKNARP
ncbi:PHP domain-containing protein [Anaerotignum faecicola]|nr:PHP domain-containing protein [Anaerotignum faecicola]